MNSTLVKLWTAQGEYQLIARYIVNCVSYKLPRDYRSKLDWYQDVCLFIILNKTDILNAEDALNLLFKVVWNKINDSYRRQYVYDRYCQDLNEISIQNTIGYYDDVIINKVIMVSKKELHYDPVCSSIVNSLFLDSYVNAHNFLGLSRTNYYRKKSDVIDVVKNSLKLVLADEN